MVSRVGSAVLALVATILLACAIFLAPWWSGHPTVDGNQYKVREVSVHLLSAEYCDHVDTPEEKCNTLPLVGSFTAQEYIEVAAVGIVAFASLILALLALGQKPSRRAFAKLVMAAAGASFIVAIALVIQGPELEGSGGHKVSMPIGPGMVLFGLGAISAIVAGIFALQPTARPRAAVSAPQPQQQWQPPPYPQQQSPYPLQQQQPQPEIDVLALLQQDERVAMGSPPPPGPGGPLPGPHGPLGVFGQQPPPPPNNYALAPNLPPPPAFGQPPAPIPGSPQLRPLYDAAPNQGGTGGYVPQPPAPLPMRPPTPMPRAAVSAATGIPTPPPFDSTLPAGAKSKTLPPPLRGKPPTMPPPRPPPPGAASGPINRPGVTVSSLAVPPPPVLPVGAPHTRAQTDPIESLQTVQHDKHDDTADRFDAAATTARDPASRNDTSDAGDNTDVGVVPIGDGFDGSTNEGAAFGDPATGTDVGRADTAAMTAINDPGVVSPDDIETRGRPKFSRKDLDTEEARTLGDSPTARAPARPSKPRLPDDHDGKDVRDIMIEKPTVPAKPGAAPRMPMPAPRTTPPPIAASALGGAPRPGGRTTPPAQSAQSAVPVRTTGANPSAKVPITTAPASLPPPTAKQAETSGPSPACPQCEAPMAWVEEHLRFYCKSCKMYF